MVFEQTGEWDVRLGFVCDVLEGALVAAEQGRVYRDAELIRRALAYLEQHVAQLTSA